MVLSYFQRLRQERRIESKATTGRQKKNDCFSVDGVLNHCNTVFESMGCFHHFCLYQAAQLSLSDADIETGVRKRNKTRCVEITYDRMNS